MTSTLSLSLTDELRAFVDRQCGDGTDYSTPSEFMRDVLREKKARLEARNLREGILEGYADLLHGRQIEYQGDLQVLLKEAEAGEKRGW